MTETTMADVTRRKPRTRSSLGVETEDALELIGMVRRGLSFRRLREFQRQSGLTMSRIASVTRIPSRTLSRRQESGRLEPDESDRLFRISRIFDLAVDLFEGDADAAREWLETPLRALGDEVPLDLASTDAGAREVESLITRLDHGVFP
jgi:putative toxin-antitoxin system antitoxin component (TIGR02293 family)